jgi:hypothetical protein
MGSNTVLFYTVYCDSHEVLCMEIMARPFMRFSQHVRFMPLSDTEMVMKRCVSRSRMNQTKHDCGNARCSHRTTNRPIRSRVSYFAFSNTIHIVVCVVVCMSV